MYIKRTLIKSILESSQTFPALLLTGPRQVGKTTLLQKAQADHKRSYVSLDELDLRLIANEDPARFLGRLTLPVLIDEVQYAPNLFPYIKMIVDQKKTPGLFWLTGSQQFSMMKNISESLAGRIAILDLQGVSLAEEMNRHESPPFLPSIAILKDRQKHAAVLSTQAIYHKIWRGSYPNVILHEGKNWQRFYESYITTYIERDVREYLKIDNLITFQKFMQVAAAHTGQMLNYRQIAKKIGLSEPTVKSWLNVLQATGIIKLLPPYFNNMSKRVIKSPKLYFMDTGLVCFLTGWLNPDVLERGAMSGALLETYVISEVIKSYIHNGERPRIYYYRDKSNHEVDLLIEKDGTLYPIEIKQSASIRNSHFKGFDFLKTLQTPIGHGCLLCFCQSLLAIQENIDAVPIPYL